ncbi:SDR family NAD(P)-dependent oxidoreductase [Actinomadura sp. NAK00032]|uniref:SDR family NAD(P)-dependent oxidoreductase n=1 Tax=Actinomadura sp. NAK00032 TaxID=2742128 RepID=UPI00159217D8|nr:SDR family NAD(P)-dependent oxidoreductase [Actinomadura sp. NAK00032]QKW35615.1 SDR family NAD(P)-dependent oxidoreductase [Actinomadura sp. NAK00032]
MTAPEPIGPAALDGIAAAARAVPGVADAAAVVRRGVRPAAPAAPAPPAPPARAAAPVPDRPPADLDGGPPAVPDGAPRTLQEALREAARLAPGKGTVYIRQGREDDWQSYPELLREAERVLAGLRAAGLRPGDAALFAFADNRAYITAFWGCVLGGFLPTPVAVAPTYQRPNEPNRKLRNAWKLLGRPVLVTDTATAGALADVRELWDEPDVRILTADDLLAHPPDRDWFPAAPDDPVLNLLTSGSTGVPKCVRHTNASVAARSLAVAAHCGLTEDDVSLIWMPFDHVTVAMYNVRDVFARCRHVNARTEHFLADPLLWLEWMDAHRVTNTWAPNFAYAMVNELAGELRGRSLDLSCVREMVNAGEPVVAATSHRFLELLAPHGLRPDAMVPCWGMSETCSGVTYTRQSRDDRAAGTVAVDPATLGGDIRYLDPGGEHGTVLSTVGAPIPGVRLRVVDDDGGVLPEGRVGELRITGDTMMAGYHANAEADRDSYAADGWYRTGDLAFVRDGEVVIAGRRKDQIIVRGVNHLAHEIESVVARVDGVRVTFVAAAGLREPGAGSDRLAVFFVPERWAAADLARIAADVRAVLGREAGLAPDLLVPVTAAEFPKTGSGKIQRSALADRLRAGAFADRVIGTAGEPAGSGLVRRQWTLLPADADADAPDAGSGARLVFAAADDLRRLRVDGPLLAVHRGDAFAADGPGRYRVRADDRAQVRRLLEAVTAEHGPPGSIVFALPLSLEGGVEERLAAAAAELTALIGALAGGESGRPPVLVLTRGAVHARDGDAVDLGVCALPALVRTAAAEVPALRVRQLDLPADPDRWPDALRAERTGRDRDGAVVAARAGRRWAPRLSPVPEEPGPGEPPVVPGGRYLVTGGLGGIAHDLAGHLVAAYGVRLLLAGRSPVGGADADREKAGRLAGLRALGDVRYRRLDVADAAALESAVAAAEADWGAPLDGVLHLAAADPTGQWDRLDRHTLANETAGTFTAQFRAKVAGTLAVARLLDRRPDAALVLFGSVNGEFGGHSFGAYAAASGFLAGFADHWHHARGRRVRCLAWSMWTGAGVNRGRPAEPARRRGFRPLGPDEGLRLFLAALAAPHHYLLLGLDLANPGIVEELAPDAVRAGELLVAYTGEAAADEVRAAVAPHAAACPVPVRVVAVPRVPRDADGRVDAAVLLLDAAPGRARRVSAPPGTDLERRIAALWSAALDRPAVGRDDSFFELGGNSLRATRLLALLDERLAVRLTTQELYENPTVAGVADIVADTVAGRRRPGARETSQRGAQTQ